MIISSKSIPIVKAGEVRWEKKDFLLKESAGVWVEVCKRENSLVKYDITRDVDTTCGYIKAFYTFVLNTVSKKHTLF